MSKLKAISRTVMFTAKKYSPEILLGLGIVGVGVSTVLACKATLEVDVVLNEHAEYKEKIQHTIELHEEGEVNYPVEAANKDLKVLKVNTAVSIGKLYAPSATLMVVSIGFILGAYRIMSQRQVALMAAYKVMEEAFTTYRGRVVKELGEAKDAHFMYGTETITDEETVIDENGKKKKITKEREELIPGAKLSGFARWFEDQNL